MRYRPRALAGRIREALEDLPVVVVTGLRQTGKSTLLLRDPVLAKRRYVSLDDFAQLEAARRNPEAFARQPGPLTIDEAQRCPELLLAIKAAVDADRRPGRFLLSGSANFALLRGVTESLAGRALYLTLRPFTRRELSERARTEPVIKSLFDTGRLRRDVSARGVTAADLTRGGLPPVCLKLVRNPRLWFQGYEQTYLERDVRNLSRLTDLASFRQLLRLASLRTGQVLSVSDLARDAKLNVATTSRYLSVLEASFVVDRLAPFLSNRTSRLIKSPKLYLADSGLATHLAGGGPARLSTDDPLAGAILETYVESNLAGTLEASWPEARLAFWHVQGRYEVDFVVEAGGDTLALEVKAGARWRGRDLAGLHAFLEKNPRCRAGVLAYGGTQAVQLEDRLWAVPLALALA